MKFICLALFAFSIFFQTLIPVFAQTDGSSSARDSSAVNSEPSSPVPKTTEKAVAPAQAQVQENIRPQAAITTTPSISPATSIQISPSIASLSIENASKSGPTIPGDNTIPESAFESGEEEGTNSNLIYYVLGSAPILAIGGYGTFKIRKKKRRAREKESLKCLDIKKMMDDKFRELTDIKGHLRNKLGEKSREALREAVKDTTFERSLDLIEKAEEEYGRLKQLYKKCAVDYKMTRRRVFIVHGWGSYPEEGWFPWLKKELDAKNFEVEILEMPDPEEPKINEWVSRLAKTISESDKHTYLIGHSIGCQAIIRYLETINKKIGGAVLVAGWFVLNNLETEKEKSVAQPWLETPINYKKVRSVCPKIVAIFSENDKYVGPENIKFFQERLKAKVIIDSFRHHFTASDGVFELPSVLDALLKLETDA